MYGSCHPRTLETCPHPNANSIFLYLSFLVDFSDQNRHPDTQAMVQSSSLSYNESLNSPLPLTRSDHHEEASSLLFFDPHSMPTY